MTTEAIQPTPSTPSRKANGEDFRTTRWTQVSRAKADSPEGRRALAELCHAYYEPVVAFLRCELREADAARELTHEFFAGAVLTFDTFWRLPTAPSGMAEPPDLSARRRTILAKACRNPAWDF